MPSKLLIGGAITGVLVGVGLIYTGTAIYTSMLDEVVEWQCFTVCMLFYLCGIFFILFGLLPFYVWLINKELDKKTEKRQEQKK